jgi:hypothetical protein
MSGLPEPIRLPLHERDVSERRTEQGKEPTMSQDDGMLNLSEVIMKIQHETEQFEKLEAEIRRMAREGGYRFFRMDVRPPFDDTPENWEDRLEAAFY